MKHKIIVMLGSGKFVDDHQREAKRLTLEGNLVIPFAMYRGEKSESEFIDPKDKPMLHSICDQKVELCDAVFVVNPDGYIGPRTMESIRYAESLGKEVIYMNPIK